MRSDPYLRLPVHAGVVELLLGAEDDPATVENCDGFLVQPDGTKRSFTVLSLDEVSRVMDRWSMTGESMSGAHLRVPDLVIVRRGGVEAIAACVNDLAERLPVVESPFADAPTS